MTTLKTRGGGPGVHPPTRSGLRLLAAVCVCVAAAYSQTPGNDCYGRAGSGQIVIGNSAIEIRLDAATGAISGLFNKRRSVEYLEQGTPEVFRLVYSSGYGAAAGDLWSAASGTLINSSRQKIAASHFVRTARGAKLEVIYDRLRLERRMIGVQVKYTVELQAGSEDTRWRIAVENRDQGTLREVQFPFVANLAKLDWLLMPNHSGQRLRDPVEKLSDEIPVVSLEYPARASMQWFDYYSPHAGLYMASYDKTLAYTRLCFGRANDNPAAAMWITKYPFAASGPAWESPDVAVGIHAGDWHRGADQYRKWLESWVPPADVSPLVREMTGGIGGMFIKDMRERLVNRYEDIVHYAETLPAGATFMLVGWFYNGHDTYYPEYVPISDLGGASPLVEAIDQVHRGGRTVNAYMNARLANNETDTYRKHGSEWVVLAKPQGVGVSQLSFAELREYWNNQWDKGRRGEGWFAVMCPAVKGWQDHLVSTAGRIIRDYHFDGIFIDQPGSYYAELCYNPHHGHSTPATAWGPGYLEMLRRIRLETREITPASFLWEEGMNDVYAQYLDYHLDKNPVWEPMRTHPEAETFVEMWRYTVPAAIIVNGPQSYSYPPSKDKVYGDGYKFVMGIRGVGSLGDEESKITETAEERSRRLAVAENIARLWKKGSEFFFYGRFLDDVGLTASNPDVLARAYRGRSGVAVAVWNTSAQPARCELAFDLEAAGIDGSVSDVLSLNTGRRLEFQVRGRTLTTQIRPQPHAIDAIVLRTSSLPREVRNGHQ